VLAVARLEERVRVAVDRIAQGGRELHAEDRAGLEHMGVLLDRVGEIHFERRMRFSAMAGRLRSSR
jgi:hypothetical protein